MQQRNNRAYRKREFKPERHENQNTNNSKTERNQRTLCQLAAYERAHSLGALDVESGIWQRLHDLLFDLVARVQRGADRDVTLSGLHRFLDRCVGKSNGLQRVADLADINFVRCAQCNQIAAAKIDAEILLATEVKGSRSSEQQRERAHTGNKAFAQEIDVL